MKPKYIIGLIGTVILISAFIVSSANADKPVKYKLMSENAPISILVTGAGTETLTVQAKTADHTVTNAIYIAPDGLPHQSIAVYYNVKYTNGVTEIYPKRLDYVYNTEDPILNNVAVKNSINSFAISNWNWDIPAQRTTYNKKTAANQ